VVVLDRGLPDMDGTEAASIMRAGGFRGAILIASGRTGTVHLDACRSSGADAVLTKPFTLAYLVDRINNAIGTGASPAAPAPAA
jgi:DNA-binding response OmpR family regulator